MPSRSGSSGRNHRCGESVRTGRGPSTCASSQRRSRSARGCAWRAVSSGSFLSSEGRGNHGAVFAATARRHSADCATVPCRSRKTIRKKSARSFARSGESAAEVHMARKRARIGECFGAGPRAGAVGSHWRRRPAAGIGHGASDRSDGRRRSHARRRWNATRSPPGCARQEATAPRRRKNWASGPRRCTENSSRRGHESKRSADLPSLVP
jgi:hypothetical protein